MRDTIYHSKAVRNFKRDIPSEWFKWGTITLFVQNRARASQISTIVCEENLIFYVINNSFLEEYIIFPPSQRKLMTFRTELVFLLLPFICFFCILSSVKCVIVLFLFSSLHPVSIQFLLWHLPLFLSFL